MTKSILSIFFITLALSSCKEKPKQSDTTQTADQQPAMASAPAFNADSAYAYVDQQVKFGPRVPNTPVHVQTGNYLAAKLKQFGCQVTEQSFVATGWDGKKLNARNIIGSINPNATKRIVLASHWDSRPHSDQDPDKADQQKPVPAANDGASGVGVLLELARTIQQSGQKPTVGIDIIFFDAEDWGNSDKAANDKEKESGDFDYVGFCLGSRYWAKNPHKPGYSAYYGVLLDMVGAKGATFPKEGYSVQVAPNVVNTIWQTASRAGYSQYFVDATGGSILDDHIAPNYIAKIPMVDIIHTSMGGMSTFFPAWHTADDTMANIDRGTLKAVGQTLLQVLYNEQ